uniref:WAP domain-containing protein n=1 Tax=Tanacetum cinerariifolium TaxID=118510 RepID=A0A6L2J4R9_TANCI|nr:hypothetical protein [Tanacetum cinerariifolium]
MAKLDIFQFTLFATLLAFIGVFGESKMTPLFKTRSTGIKPDCTPQNCRWPPDPSTCPPLACEVDKDCTEYCCPNNPDPKQSPSHHALLVCPGQEIPIHTPYMTHPNGVHKTLTLRKMVRPPFTLPPVIEAVIAKLIIAPPSERYKSSFLSSPPPLPSCKRCRLPSPPVPAPAPPPPPFDMLPPCKRVSIGTWRYQEGAPSTFELGESSSAHIISVTGEHLHHTIPLLVTRTVCHEAHIERIKVHLEELLVERVESIEQEIQTL